MTPYKKKDIFSKIHFNPLKTLLSKKNIRVLFFILCCIVIIINNNIIQCAAFNTHNSALQQFTDLIDSLTPMELEQFNHNLNYTFGQRVIIAALINITIVGAVYYGPTLFQNSVDFLSNVPSYLGSFTNAVIHDIPAYFTQTARDFALNQFNNATPERQLELLNHARNIIEQRYRIGGAA